MNRDNAGVVSLLVKLEGGLNTQLNQAFFVRRLSLKNGKSVLDPRLLK
jgi:hypothetical protein